MQKFGLSDQLWKIRTIKIASVSVSVTVDAKIPEGVPVQGNTSTTERELRGATARPVDDIMIMKTQPPAMTCWW